ncbi:MAG: hypothetical protein QOI27_1235, partial [Gaiellaceae bacterium]|nr:hypothetical protein [Gaiellaceae bacterium]
YRPSWLGWLPQMRHEGVLEPVHA